MNVSEVLPGTSEVALAVESKFKNLQTQHGDDPLAVDEEKDEENIVVLVVCRSPQFDHSAQCVWQEDFFVEPKDEPALEEDEVSEYLTML